MATSTFNNRELEVYSTLEKITKSWWQIEYAEYVIKCDFFVENRKLRILSCIGTKLYSLKTLLK